MQTTTLLRLDQSEMEAAISEMTDDRLDDLISLTDNAEMANRLARIERGKRTETRLGNNQHVLPGGTSSLTKTERNKRSEEKLVAEYEPDDEEVEELGWKKLVTKARAKRRESIVADPSATADLSPDDVELENGSLLIGDFRERLDDLPDASVDLIVTDPPYPEEFMHLWSDLGELAARVLGERGILFAMTGQIYLPEVMSRLGEHLNYGWTYNYRMTEGAQSRIMGRHIIQTWKPVLAYTTGKFPSGEWGKDEIRSSGPSKDLYEWEQQEGPMQEIIERHTAQGGLVLDPMMGVGTYGADTANAGRRFIGVELDNGRFEQAAERLLDE